MAAWALEHGLQPCAGWDVRVEGSDSCFGGRVEPLAVTAVTQPAGDRYLVRIGVYASGVGHGSAIDRLNDEIRTRLEPLFEPGRVTVRQVPAPMQVQRING